jgi:acyl-CoA synthetase (NDP forming)
MYTTSMSADDLDALFYPDSIAIIGAPSDDDKAQFLQYLQTMGYEEDIYPVNPSADEIRGLRAYPDIREVPGPVDLAIVKVPRRLVPDVIRASGEHGVNFAHIFTGGFSEATDDPGRELAEDLVGAISESDIRVIGPNCVGIYSPGGRVPFIDNLTAEMGPVGVVSQSGGLATDVCRHGQQHGLRFSKVVTVGNMVDMNHVEMLLHLYEDEETELVTAYLEGVRSAREGRELFELFDEHASETPTLVLKGGRTETGARAASSHTGALAGDYNVWQGMFEQTEVIEVENFDELLNASVAFRYWDQDRDAGGSQRDGVALAGHGGGLSVTAVDKADAVGLSIPELDPELVSDLESLDIAAEIASLGNPIDIPDILASGEDTERTKELVSDVLQIVARDDSLGTLIMYLNIQNILGYGKGDEFYEPILNAIIDFDAAADEDLDFGVVLRSNEEPEIVDLFQFGRQHLLEADIPVFNDLGDALESIAYVRAFLAE